MNELERTLRYNMLPFVDVSAHGERFWQAKLDVCFVATVTGPVNIIFKLWNLFRMRMCCAVTCVQPSGIVRSTTTTCTLHKLQMECIENEYDNYSSNY